MEPPATGGGPAPFLIKTYDMVDDSSTDEIVSWSSTAASFVVWDPPSFAAKLLPTYFKHNNFSSFIRQLNTYGFRKIDPERWEFANEEFVQDHKHLLKNIHRRKPIHSHTQGSLISDPERTALEEEIDCLSKEKAALAADLWRFRQQQAGTMIQLEDLERRLVYMENRQARMIAFLERAIENPRFVENLVKMAGADDLAMQRRLGLSSIATASDGNLSEDEGAVTLVFGEADTDEDGLMSAMRVDRSHSSSRSLNLIIEEVDVKSNEQDCKGSSAAADLQGAAPAANQGPPPLPLPLPGGANDVFWEQFLMESPGKSDPEEASCMRRNRKDLEQLTL